MQAMRSHKFTGKHSFRLSVWNPMSQGREDDSIDTLMRRLYVMPKQSSRLECVSREVFLSYEHGVSAATDTFFYSE